MIVRKIAVLAALASTLPIDSALADNRSERGPATALSTTAPLGLSQSVLSTAAGVNSAPSGETTDHRVVVRLADVSPGSGTAESLNAAIESALAALPSSPKNVWLENATGFAMEIAASDLAVLNGLSGISVVETKPLSVLNKETTPTSRRR